MKRWSRRKSACMVGGPALVLLLAACGGGGGGADTETLMGLESKKYEGPINANGASSTLSDVKECFEKNAAEGLPGVRGCLNKRKNGPEVEVANSWCGSSVDYSGNALPAGWISTPVRSGPGIVGEQLQGLPFDSGAAVGSGAAAADGSISRVVVKYQVATGASTWGQLHGVEFLNSEGSVWHFEFAHANSVIGVGNLEFRPSRQSATFASLAFAPVGAQVSPVKLPGFSPGLHDVTLEVFNGGLIATVAPVGVTSSTPLQFAVALPSDASASGFTQAHHWVYTTTDSGIAADNLSIKCYR